MHRSIFAEVSSAFLFSFPSSARDHIAIIVDRGHPLHIAAVGNLIAFGVEAVAGTAVGDGLLRAAQIVHPLEGTGDALPGGVEADLAVHIDVKGIFRFANGSEKPVPSHPGGTKGSERSL